MWLAASSRESKSRRNALTVSVIHARCGWLDVPLDSDGYCEEGAGEHGQGGPAVPGTPAPDLVLSESDEPFGGLKGLLDTPALAGHGDQGAQPDRPRAAAAQVGVLPGAVVAADQQVVHTVVDVAFGQKPKPGGVFPVIESSRSVPVF